MSEKTWQRNTSGMVAHAHHRKQEKRKHVEEAITRLLREQQAITFNAVAKAARVSKAYLYTQPDLRERIEALRQQELEQAVRQRTAHPAAGKTDASRDLVILAKDRRIKELDAENRKLQQQLKVALGKAYDRL
jgi:AcrR family transcriptional regulator